MDRQTFIITLPTTAPVSRVPTALPPRMATPPTHSRTSSASSSASNSQKGAIVVKSHQQPVERTNTLVITSIPKSFFDPSVLDVLKHHFLTYGEINRWVPLPGFGRILVVFYHEESAENAKQQCDPIVLEGEHFDSSPITLRVYRADPNPIIPHDADSTIPDANRLRPPAQEMNFLISPPGSPPVGWEPIVEDPPNSCPLADDLVAALEKLKAQEQHSSIERLLDPDEGSGVGVFVEDFDSREDKELLDDEWVYGETAPTQNRWRPIPTSMPPVPIMS